jgi:hypothetical protein
MTDREKEYQKEYSQRPEAKDRQKEYRQRPEVQANKKVQQKEYRQRPEVQARKKEYRKERRQIPEVKAKDKEYQKEYWKKYRQRPNVIKTQSSRSFLNKLGFAEWTSIYFELKKADLTLYHSLKGVRNGEANERRC